MGHIAKIGRKEDNHTCKQFASINFVFVYIKQVKRCLFFFPKYKYKDKYVCLD